MIMMMQNENYEGKIDNAERKEQKVVTPRKSVVRVQFPDRGIHLSYYNDRFDLKVGDLVYVEGKLQGLLGRVIEVNYHFKIKIAEYKRVITVVDTSIHGNLFATKENFITFERDALPREKVIAWFKAPSQEEFAIGWDDSCFTLDDLSGMNVSKAIRKRGYRYYIDARIKYISLDNGQGYAIILGSELYEVEFECVGREIRNLYCTCLCGCNCKHEVAVMLYLKELLGFINQEYQKEYEHTGYFAVISKGAPIKNIIRRKRNENLVHVTKI
ncbi:MAG: hypothetical protein II324_02295 [Selenomonadales bacterium]|nr:hypothetical protein [Selenomonadales bacterium]